MHKYSWLRELKHLVMLSLLALAVGWYTGEPAWCLALGLLTYLGWNIAQLRDLELWLQNDDERDPPESLGVWGAVLDEIYRMHKRGKEERLRLQTIVDYLRDSFTSLPYGAVMVSANGTIEWFNPAAEQMFGLRYPDDTGRTLVTLVRSPAFIQYFEAESYRAPLDIASPVRNTMHLQINVTFFGQRSRLIIARDVTHTHKLEQMRKDFIANVSHELRTPLTVINGYLQTFSGSAALKDERLRRAFEQMLVQSTRMERLIQDLILLSRLETVPESGDQSRIDMKPMLSRLRDDALGVAHGEREISIECDESIAVMGSHDELFSAFSNLVMNAAKYTEPGDSIVLRWCGDKKGARLEVIDSGIGIEPHHIPRLTERFYRVDKSRSIGTGGTGLGLAIVKHVLLRHQASLDIQSEPGGGSCFACVFPAQRIVTQRLALAQ